MIPAHLAPQHTREQCAASGASGRGGRQHQLTGQQSRLPWTGRWRARADRCGCGLGQWHEAAATHHIAHQRPEIGGIDGHIRRRPNIPVRRPGAEHQQLGRVPDAARGARHRDEVGHRP